jgi:hypothetical protein
MLAIASYSDFAGGGDLVAKNCVIPLSFFISDDAGNNRLPLIHLMTRASTGATTNGAAIGFQERTTFKQHLVTGVVPVQRR